MTDVSLIFCKIQMCPAELQPNYELHLPQIASFRLDFVVVKAAVKLISRKFLLKYSFLITVKVWFVQYPEILSFFLFFIPRHVHVGAALTELEWIFFLRYHS